MDCSRRAFLEGATCLGLAGCVVPATLSGKGPNLKFGVISDIHITDWASTEIFRKTLRYFRSQRVDAVMIVGDMADHGIIPQLENVAKAWYEVFPDDKDDRGNHVEKLFVYGNHDPDGIKYRDYWMDRAFKAMNLTYEEAEKLTLPRLGLAKCWEKCFNEPYAPIYIKNVKGYDFIGGHWDQWDGIHGLEDWWKANVSKINTAQPFFYFQHCTPRNTVYGADSWGDDAGQSVRCLAPFPNAVAFSGHSHRSLTDGRSYWRGEFTSIGTSTLSYVCLPTEGRISPQNFREHLNCRQGQIVSVYDDRLEIERRDFINDESLGENVVLEMPTKPSTFTVRAVAKNNIPAFAADAVLDVKKIGEGYELSFPGAFANPTANPFEYHIAVKCTLQDGKEKWLNYDWIQQDVAFSRARAAASVNRVRIDGRDIPDGTVKLLFYADPKNCYGGQGAQLISREIVPA